MEKTISDFASELGMTNEQMLEVLWKNNIIVNSNSYKLSKTEEDKVLSSIYLTKDNTLGKNKSSLDRIKIEGLFGTKSYDIQFKNAINIFVSENGCGKTTILNIITSLLSGNIKKLKSLPFDSATINIKGKEFKIDKNNIEEKIIYSRRTDIYGELLERLNRLLSPSDFRRIRNLLVHNSGVIDSDELKEYIMHAILDGPYNKEFTRMYYEEVRHIFEKLDYENRHKKEYRTVQENLDKIVELIDEEIVYFPTFRRIEEDLDKILDLSDNLKRELKFKVNNSRINFGISDVETTLKDLTEKLKNDANTAYTKMNADILNDLLGNRIELSKKQKRVIDKEKINIVINRIGKNKIKEFDKLMNFIDGNYTSSLENKNFLEYYLYKLIEIYESQKAIDEKIKTFVKVCNKYLVNTEISYDEVLTCVSVIEKRLRKEISFKDLSSGEKQIISLFSKLYLDLTRSCIFIIDEPELSLSMYWQKMLLEDIYASKKIALLISTTHSPFIFKNNFREYAKDLDYYRVE